MVSLRSHLCLAQTQFEEMASKEEEVKVLALWVSPYSNRVLIALEEIGVAYHYQEENMKSKSMQLLEANPIHKKVPVLIHNGAPICESLIILEYIHETWSSSNKGILPSDPYDRATARFWANFIDNKFWPAGFRIIVTEGEVQEQAKVEFIESFILIEGALEKISGGKPYFGGENFGYLDIALLPFVPLFHSAETFGNFKLPLERCPNLKAWIQLVIERENVKKILPSPERALEYCTVLYSGKTGSNR